jgi:hypothetical protein
MPRDDMPMIPPRSPKKQPHTRLLLDDHDGRDTPTIAAEGLRRECMFPADEMTEEEHVRFAVSNSRDLSMLPH